MANILIVDDESGIREMLERTLARDGHQSVQAADAAAARAALEKQSFELALVDINMPGESGLDLVHYARGAFPGMVVIMATGVDEPESIDAAIEAGVYGYVLKPFELRQMLLQVKNALAHQQADEANQRYREGLEQKLAEKIRDIKESEAKFRAISSSAHDAIVMVDDEGNIVFWNEAAEKIFGYTSEEVCGKNFHRIFAPDRYRDAHRSAFLKFRESGEGPAIGKNLELEAIRRDGKEIPVELSLSAAKLAGRWHSIGIIRDISERRKAEKELRDAEVKMRQLLAAITSILITVDGEGRVLEWNETAEKTFGISREETVGKRLADCGMGWDETAMSEAMVSSRKEGHDRRLDNVRYQAPDGKERFLGLTISPIREGDGKMGDQVMIRAADITARRLLESQLVQAQKLESIGQLAAGIAHEINTPTQYVGDNTRFLKEGFEGLDRLLGEYEKIVKECSEKEGLEERLKRIAETAEEIDLEYLREEIPSAISQSLEGVDRVAKIVRAMKEFSHPGSDEKTPTDMNKAIENTVTVARNEWKYVAELEMDFDDTLPLVPCLPGEMNQVILNMIVNASHAIADVVGDGPNGKGNITIGTRKEGDWVLIRIEDTGAGIPEHIRSRIFDPFFTTKEVGKGTGQGLSIAHNVIVEKHGGTIDVESEVGKGTAFIIRLPLED